MMILITLICLLGACVPANIDEENTTELVTTTPDAAVTTCVSEIIEEEPSIPQLLFQATVSYNSDTKIERTTLDSQGFDISIYFEIPIFDESLPSFQSINAFLQALNDDFYAPENENLSVAWQAAAHKSSEDYGSYYYERDAIINTETDSLVSVTIRYNWWVGGVNDYGSESYNFCAQTGALLSLSDLVGESNEQLLASISQCVYEAILQSDMPSSSLQVYESVEELEFAVRGDELWLLFDKYEIGHGLEVKLPLLVTYEGPIAIDMTSSPYREVIDAYQAFMNRGEDVEAAINALYDTLAVSMGCSGEQEWELWCSCVDARAGNLRYAIHDLNDDGMDELILLSDEYSIHAIYTLCENRPTLVGGYWNRRDCAIDAEGILYEHASSGASHWHTASYRLLPGSAELQLIEMVGVEDYDSQLSEPLDMPRYYRVLNGEKAIISYEEANTYWARFPSIQPDTSTKDAGLTFVSIPRES